MTTELPKNPPARVAYLNITTDQELQAFCDQLARCRWLAFDTEFVSEATYRPVLCLVQVATEGQLALIDALAVQDMTPFWEVVAQPSHETIVHAGRGEVEFCLRAVGRVPARLFDVQLAAGLIGIEYPAGFRTLIYRVLGQSSKKEETRTDWRRRPLSERQIQYALDDVRHLAALRDRLREELERRGRLGWLEDEMVAWQQEVEKAFTQERWRRVSGTSSLDRRGLAIVRELWRWREAEAQRRNCPTRRVLRDDLIVELAKRQSADVKRIQAVRGLERGDLTRHLPKLAACIDLALKLPEQELPEAFRHESVPQLSVLGQFLFAALGSVCRQADLAPGLVGNPNDIRELIAYRAGQINCSEPPVLARGWRAEVVGQLFDELLAGKKAIRIANPDSDHPLVFEELAPNGAPRS
ncbi:MAG: HRDC domain-containing protein [Thermoguttaceae bacterium]